MSHLRVACVACALFVAALVAPRHAHAQGPTATLTYPANGAVNADMSQPFQWTTVANAQWYYLYVGTTLGGKDLIDSEGLHVTSFQAAALPAGQTLYVRLWTDVGNVWTYVDSTFTAAVPITPRLTYPADGAINADITQPITWTSVANPQWYYLYIGTTLGASDLVDTGGLHTTSYLVSGLPSGRTLYARIWSAVGGIWQYRDSTFTAAPTVATPLAPTFVFPTNGAVNVTQPHAFQWTPVASAQWYYLYVGTRPGAQDLVDSGGINATSYLVSGLPSGQTLYARIWVEVGGVWRYNDVTFTAAPGVPLAPTLTYPANGATNVDVTQPFTWTSVPNAQAYYLYVGTTTGTSNVVDSYGVQTTSFTASGYQQSNVASGITLHARVWAEVGGVWRYTDSTFSAAPVQVIATITSPANGSSNADVTQPIQWTSVPGAQAYYIELGLFKADISLGRSYYQLGTSYLPVTPLPVGLQIYARVWTEFGGVWRFSDSTFRATPSPLAATITSPTLNASIDQPQSIQWTSIPNAQAYKLYVGSTVGAKDILDTGPIHATSFPAAGFPSGVYYARLWTQVGGVWQYSDTRFWVSGSALWYPANGAVNIDASIPLQWNLTTNATAYRLLLGSSPSGNDLADSGWISNLFYLAPTLPAGQTIYARLMTQYGWSSRDTTFTVRPSSASDATIAFDGLSNLGGSFSNDTESGFVVSPLAGNWFIQGGGPGARFIAFLTPPSTGEVGEVRVVDSGHGLFTFRSVDLFLWKPSSPTPYVITGLLNGATVFTLEGGVPSASAANEYPQIWGMFRTVFNPHTTTAIDTLTISLANGPGNWMGIDNIAVSR